MVLTPVSENKALTAAFLVTLVLHLVMLSPMSRWLNRNLMPQLTGESLEVDINEIQSNDSAGREPEPKKPEKKPEKSQPRLPEKELPTLKQSESLVPKEKKQLSPYVREEPEPLQPKSTVAEEPLPKKESPEPPSAEEPLPKKESPEPPSAEESLPKKESPEPSKIQNNTKRLEKTEEPSEVEQSPLFYKKQEKKAEKAETLPDNVRDTLRHGKPEETRSENLQFSMNSYKWRFDRFIDNWVVDIQKWWKAPLDYIDGKMPEGGDLWVQVHLAPSGKLLSYKILSSHVTAEMELKAIQALIGSLKRPELPPSFVKDELVINWRFIYPPLRPRLKMRR